MLQKKCYVSLHIHCIILYIFSNFVLFLCANPVEIMLAIYIFSYFYIATGTTLEFKVKTSISPAIYLTELKYIARQQGAYILNLPTACLLHHGDIFV